MDPIELPLPANTIRKNIEKLIPDVTDVDRDEHGNKKYGGHALSELITQMKVALEINENWEGRLRYWSIITRLVNPQKKAYLIPLLREIQLNPGEPTESVLRSGWFIEVNDEPRLGAGATALFIVPC
ncbi:hypothetical protein N7478_000684 [Penicillium angulare]|uniref:uncharacterized protein n=1 Tax=Penicillium angulare TaxID=116970 RepID=UPI002541B6DD|nr:uncharacterized protein N7478_000684 [Penicillium angulare]KAJ5291433.1 hypothetical protein N7478_000684 [Penicillium angulare]